MTVMTDDPELCLRCSCVLDTDEGMLTGICPECWTEEDGDV